jgi:hypothetical protein
LTRLAIALSLAGCADANVRPVHGDAANHAVTARIAGVDGHPFATQLYRLLHREWKVPLPELVLDVDNGTEAPIYVYRQWLRQRWDADTRELQLRFCEQPAPWTPDECQWFGQGDARVEPHQAVELRVPLSYEHRHPMDSRRVIVEVAWSDRSLTTPERGCTAARARDLVPLERGVVTAVLDR